MQGRSGQAPSAAAASRACAALPKELWTACTRRQTVQHAQRAPPALTARPQSPAPWWRPPPAGWPPPLSWLRSRQLPAAGGRGRGRAAPAMRMWSDPAAKAAWVLDWERERRGLPRETVCKAVCARLRGMRWHTCSWCLHQKAGLCFSTERGHFSGLPWTFALTVPHFPTVFTASLWLLLPLRSVLKAGKQGRCRRSGSRLD